MPDQPSIADGALNPGFVFVDAAAGPQEWQVDQLDMDAPVPGQTRLRSQLDQLARSLSGSANGRSAANFIGLVGFRDVVNVDHRVLEQVAVERFAAGASH